MSKKIWITKGELKTIIFEMTQEHASCTLCKQHSKVEKKNNQHNCNCPDKENCQCPKTEGKK